MDAYIALYPLIAVIWVVVTGRTGTIIMDMIRTEPAPDMDNHHVLYTPQH